jgi:acetolactate synthase I/II/III large subunit
MSDDGVTHAVLALVGRVDGTARLLLTRRSHQLRAHPGEIALPGGRCVDGEDPESAALREAAEEVGLEADSVEVVGRGPLVKLAAEDVIVVPVFARWRRPHQLRSSEEVELPLLVRIAELLDGSTQRRFDAADGRSARAWQLADGLVWGVTALVVELLLNEMAPGSLAAPLAELPAVSPTELKAGLPNGRQFDSAPAMSAPAMSAPDGSAARQRHAADLLVAQLAIEGITELCTLTGGHISPVFDGCVRHGIRLVDFRHEAAAVHAADALARLRRRTQAAAVTAGPGLTNAVTAVANAWHAQSPVVVLSGRNPLLLEGLGGLQDAPHVELLRPITKRAETAFDGQRLAELLHWSFTAAAAGRSGPTLLDLPLDVQLTPVPAGQAQLPGQRRFTALAGPDPDEIAAVVRLLAGARHPVIVAGSGAYWSHAEHELAEVAAALNAPVYCNGLARGMLPPEHRSALRLTRGAAMRDADVIMVIGADLDFRLNYGRAPEFPLGVHVIHVDPEPQRIGHTREVRHGVVSDVRLFLRTLAELAGRYAGRAGADWLDSLHAAEQAGLSKREAKLGSDQVPIHPLRFVGDVARFAERDAVLVADGGDVASMAASVLRPALPGHWLDTGPFGCLGVGIPFAMAARIEHPHSQVMVLLGDGAFGFNGMELDSAVRQNLPFVAAIGNDGAWGEMRTFHELLFGAENLQAQYLSQETRYDVVARGLGAYGERVERPEQILPALARAADSGLPAVVDVVIDPSYRHRGNTANAAAAMRAFAHPS